VCSREEQLLAKGIGLVLLLRAIRQQWQLSLREVEERTIRFAQERGNLSYKVSASCLDRLEREAHELTVNKLIVLAGVSDRSIGSNGRNPTERIPAFRKLVCQIDSNLPKTRFQELRTALEKPVLTNCGSDY
jgi:hypothetical protein